MFSCKQVPVLALALLVALLCGGAGVALGAAPVVKGISPNNGSVTGSTQVTISGEGFIAGSTVKFGSNAGTGVTIESSKQIKVTSPVGTGLAGISVTNSNGTSAATPYDQFSYDAAPTALWLGLNGNNTTYLGPVGYFAEREIVYDRGGPIEFTAGELPKGGVETDVEEGMIPVVVIEYEGYKGEYESDPEFPQKRSGKEIAEGKNTIKTYVHGFVKTALAVLHEAANKDPEVPVLLEPMNEPWGYTTPQYNGAEYGEVIAELLPEAQKAGIPLSDIYVGAIGRKSWVPAMYKAQVKLETEIQGWYFHPYGPPSGTHEENSEGVQSLPFVQAEMTSGQNNIIVSEVGYCAKDINEGKGCNGTEESGTAAANLTEMLGNAKPYHEQGWLKALLVYSRNAGGWAMQHNGGELTAQGKALEAFAESQVGWTVMKVPNPTGAKEGHLNGVSCTSSSMCFAVGTYPAKSNTALAEYWNGSEWTTETIPGPASILKSVSCTALTACTAVGASYPLGGQSKMVGEHWNGTKWKMTQMLPLPAGALLGSLTSVACSSATACIAVGLYAPYSNPLRAQTLAEAWNGTEWEVQTTVNSGNSSSVLYGVSCTSSVACVAVGTDQGKVLGESWNGTEWKSQESSIPTWGSGVLEGVSCVSSTSCTAVGNSGNSHIFAEHWDGSKWQIESTPSPLGAKKSHLTTVSCTSTTHCTAVGYYESKLKTAVTLVELWNGLEWMIQPTPNPAGSARSYLSGISCVSSACVAVGESQTTSNEWSSLAEANF